MISSPAAALVGFRHGRTIKDSKSKGQNARTAYGRCIPYSETPSMVVGWADVEGWNENERGAEWG